MLSKRKTIISVSLLVVVIFAGAVWLVPSLLNHKSNVAHAAVASSHSVGADGPYHVQGNMIIGADGSQYIFHGIGRDGLEYNCAEGPLDAASLAHMGSGTSTSGSYYWDANTVRLPLSENYWLRRWGSSGACTAAQYQALVKQTVDILTSQHMNVILDLHWVDGNSTEGANGGPGSGLPLTDSDSLTFWTQVATIYKAYPNVLFEAYNEPQGVSWACVVNGCAISPSDYPAYQGVGMQAIVNAIRKTGASNLVIVAGTNWGFDLSQVPSLPVTGGNIVYDTHPYDYADKAASTWDAAFGNVSRTYPVISTENGQYDCKADFMTQLYNYFDSHNISWTAWAWASDVGDVCAYPALITDYQGTPAPSMGQFIYQRLHSYSGDAGAPVAPPATAPTKAATKVATPTPVPTPCVMYSPTKRVGVGYRACKM